MQTQPQAEHQWLSKLVGEWDCESETDKPEAKMRATEIVRTLGGLWVLCEAQWIMPDGQPSTMIMTLGYDPQRGRYIGTFIGSMMSHLWVYEGQLDPSGNILTLDTVGPSFQSSDQMVRFQDVIEFKSPDHRTLTARMLTADNQWQTFMTVHYRRKD